MTGWHPAPRTAHAAAAYAAAEADRAARPDRYRLGADSADAVIARASRGIEPADLGNPTHWRDGLEQYLGSAAEDGRLNALGAKMVLETAAAKLRARASIARQLAAHPEIAARRLDAPIVIVGGWRTGTTFLFRLLATDPRLRAPLPAELTAPWRFAGLTNDQREALLDASAAAHDLLHRLNPTLAAVHDSGARLPEECVLAMGTDFRNWGFSSTTRLDQYSEWLSGQNLATAYQRYRAILQMLDAGDSRRWLLKAPAHTAELPQLAAAFPGACIVHLHRDIVETVASGASLFAVFRSTYSDSVDAADVGRFQAAQTERWLRRAVAFRSSTAAASVALVDLRYRDLVAAPAAAVERIYAAAGLESPGDLDGMIERYRAAHPQHEKGVHRYSPAEFAIDAGELRKRMSFYEPFVSTR